MKVEWFKMAERGTPDVDVLVDGHGGPVRNDSWRREQLTGYRLNKTRVRGGCKPTVGRALHG